MSRMMRTLLAFLALLAGLAAFAAGSQPDRKIVPGDQLRLTVSEETTLNKVYTVTEDGLLLMDFIGMVQVKGKTATEASLLIADKLMKERIVRKATVSLSFVNTTPAPEPAQKSVKVTGAVRSTLPVSWRDGMKVSDVVQAAASRNDADLSQVVLIRATGQSLKINLNRVDPTNPASNPLVFPGDEVRVPVTSGGSGSGTGGSGSGGSGSGSGSSGGSGTGGGTNPNNPPTGPITTGLVTIVGGVNRPGAYPMRAGLTLSGAIALAGGISQRGDQTRVRVDRNRALLGSYNLASDPGMVALQAGDQITVDTTAQKRFVQVLGQVRSPGLYEYTDGMTLSQAVALAGGLNPGAKGEATIVGIEDTGKGRKVSYEDIIRGYRGDVALRSGDIVGMGSFQVNQPRPAPSRPSGGQATRGKKSNDGVVIAVAAGVLLWLIGR